MSDIFVQWMIWQRFPLYKAATGNIINANDRKIILTPVWQELDKAVTTLDCSHFHINLSEDLVQLLAV